MELHVSVALANSTVLNLRKLLVGLRSGSTVQAQEVELMISRAITDLAGLVDYAMMLETQLRGLDEKDRGVQSLG